MDKILITGATGFIGSHLVEMCVEKGYDVVAFDRYIVAWDNVYWLSGIPINWTDCIAEIAINNAFESAIPISSEANITIRLAINIGSSPE